MFRAPAKPLENVRETALPYPFRSKHIMWVMDDSSQRFRTPKMFLVNQNPTVLPRSVPNHSTRVSSLASPLFRSVPTISMHPPS